MLKFDAEISDIWLFHFPFLSELSHFKSIFKKDIYYEMIVFNIRAINRLELSSNDQFSNCIKERNPEEGRGFLRCARRCWRWRVKARACDTWPRDWEQGYTGGETGRVYHGSHGGDYANRWHTPMVLWLNKNGAVRGTGGVRSWHTDARIEFAGRKQTLKAT